MSDRPALLADYLEASTDIELVLEELHESQLEARESAADWTVRQIVHHLADVEVGDAMRLRQMLAHDAPLIVAYDEERFASRSALRPTNRAVRCHLLRPAHLERRHPRTNQ